jgi:hypothetical protein
MDIAHPAELSDRLFDCLEAMAHDRRVHIRLI